MQEESEIKKEKWGKPKLFVLVRGKPEEGALLLCKLWQGDGGPQSGRERCNRRTFYDICDATICAGLTTS